MPTTAATRPRSKSTLFDVPGPLGGPGALLPPISPGPKADSAEPAVKPGPAGGKPSDKKP